MDIRHATIDDYKQIIALIKEVHDKHAKNAPQYFIDVENPLQKDYFLEFFEDENTYFIIMENEKEMIGLAILMIKETKPINILVKRTYASIEDFVISKKHQRKGYGNLLFEQCVELAKENNASSIELTVWDFNKDAIAFYKNQNMKPLTHKMTLNLKER